MRFTGFFVKVAPAACVVVILAVAGVMCQKPKSAETEAAKAIPPHIVADSALAAVKALAAADTSVKKMDIAAAKKSSDTAVKAAAAGYYTCPMHPNIHQTKPGKCPMCGMDLVFKKVAKGTAKVKGKTHSKSKT